MSKLNLQEAFAGQSPAEAVQSYEIFKSEIKKSIANHSTDDRITTYIEAGSEVKFEKAASTVDQLTSLMTNKSLSPDAMAALQTALASQSDFIGKEITTTVPLSSGFVAYDLQAPAKVLVPRPTPLRNKLPRTKGVGATARIKKINSYTNAITSALAFVNPGIGEATQNNFANTGSSNALWLNRGPQIAYNATDKDFPYVSNSLSDAVTFDAQYAGYGYEDLLALSSETALYSSMISEEKLFLYARGTASSYQGALGPVTAATLSQRTAVAGETALAATAYYVWVTASSGIGESVPFYIGTITTTSGNVIDVKITPVVGAVQYNIYLSNTSSVATTAYFKGSTPAASATVNTFVISGTVPTTGNQPTGATDTTASAYNYDGIMSYVLGSQSGYNNAINSTFSTVTPGLEFMQTLAQMYTNNLADPDEIWFCGVDRSQLAYAFLNSSNGANYRANLFQNEVGQVVGGITLGDILNPATGKLVSTTVHPYILQGTAPILSYTLPYADSNVGNIWEVRNVQDYLQLSWPKIQFSSDISTYWRGTLLSYAPGWNGAVSGILPKTVV